VTDIIALIERSLVMKPFIDKTRCAAQSQICPPIKECPTQAVIYVEDEDEPLGGRIAIDEEKCTSCGLCVSICCGQCIEMK
jgi:Pyruvate/2-oxoacid:ferredoxin oxidoreductase delta subunit